MHLSFHENRGEIPFEGSADNLTWGLTADPINETAWFNILPPLVGMSALRDLQTAEERALTTRETTIFKCPLVRFPERRNPPVNFSYMMNSQIYHPAGPAGTGNHPDPPVRLIHIRDPSVTAMFADGQDPNRARGRGRHVDERHSGGETHIVFMDGSLRRFKADYLRTETMQVGTIRYTENNKPDVIWNPWQGSHLTP